MSEHTLMSLSPRSLSIEVQSSTLGVQWFRGGITCSSLEQPTHQFGLLIVVFLRRSGKHTVQSSQTTAGVDTNT